MAKVGDLTGTNSLKAADLPAPVEVTIESYELKHFDGDARPKAILSFVNKDKTLVCNATNLKRLEKIYGTDDLDDWIGKSCTLYKEWTQDLAGNPVEGLRVVMPGTVQGAAAASPPPPASTPENPSFVDPAAGGPEDIPF